MIRSISFATAIVIAAGLIGGDPGVGDAALAGSVSNGSSATAARARHVRVEKAIPAVNDTVSSLPDSLRIWFSEPVAVPLTRVRLQHNKRELAMKGASQKAGDRMAPVTLAIPTKPGPGTYTVIWKTAGADGHAVVGTYSFVVR